MFIDVEQESILDTYRRAEYSLSRQYFWLGFDFKEVEGASPAFMFDPKLNAVVPETNYIDNKDAIAAYNWAKEAIKFAKEHFAKNS